jgi:hypothetical protein
MFVPFKRMNLLIFNDQIMFFDLFPFHIYLAGEEKSSRDVIESFTGQYGGLVLVNDWKESKQLDHHIYLSFLDRRHIRSHNNCHH